MLTFAYPIYLFLLLLIPLLWGLYILSRRSRKSRLKRFGRPEVLAPLMPMVSRYKPAIRISLTLAALGMLIIAIARPWGGITEQSTNREGIEVVAAVDASNSMLASATDDQNGPTRLSSAKVMLERMLDAMSNDRIGLVAYAGEAYTLIPVSSDYTSAKTFLSTIDPTQISSQGTNIAAAINNASASFSRDSKIGKAIVLITDAEDLEDEQAVLDAVKAARDAGIQINVIGFGTSAGSVINTQEGLFTGDDGEVVTTRLNEELAKSIAKAGGGIYVNGSSPDALSLLQKRLKEIKRTSLSTSNLVTHDELFIYFAALALLLMVADAFMVNRKNSVLSKFTFFKKEVSKMKRIVTIILAAVLGLMNLSAEVSTRKERQAIVAGNEAYKAKNYSAALAQYKIALRENPASLAALFNKALSQLQMATAMDPAKAKDKEALMQEVKQGFSSVSQHTSDNPVLASRANYNLGNMSFAEQDYQSAIDFYKQALRLNPDDDRARRNLRIAQLKLPKDKKDDKKDNKDNKDNRDQKDKKEQKPQQQPQKDQDKKEDKKEQNPQQQQNPQQPQQRQQGMSQQAADRILKHSSDKEKETLRKAMYGKEKHQQSSRRRW